MGPLRRPLARATHGVDSVFKKIWNYLFKPAYPPKRYVVLTAGDGTKIYIEAAVQQNVFIHDSRDEQLSASMNRGWAREPDPRSYILVHQAKGFGERPQ